MIKGDTFYFFRLDHCPDDLSPEYRIARSLDDLYLRFGHSYLSSFFSITQLPEVTIEHMRAINEFLIQQIS